MFDFDFGLGEDIELLRETVRAFAADRIAPRAADIDASNEFPRDLWPELGELVRRVTPAQHVEHCVECRPGQVPVWPCSADGRVEVGARGGFGDDHRHQLLGEHVERVPGDAGRLDRARVQKALGAL